MRKLRRRVLLLLGLLCALLLVAWVVWGAELLRSDTRILRTMGRASLWARIHTIGPSVRGLLDAREAGIFNSADPGERWSTSDLVEIGWDRLPKDQQRRFIESLEVIFADPTGPDEEARMINLYWVRLVWGDKLSRETILEGCLSPIADVRFYAWILLDGRLGEFEPGVVAETVTRLFEAGVARDDSAMIADALVEAAACEQVTFYQERASQIEELTNSKDQRLRRVASACVATLGGGPASREVRSASAEADAWYHLLSCYASDRVKSRLPSGLAELERLGFVETIHDGELRTSPKLGRFWHTRKLHPEKFEILWSFSAGGYELVDGKIVKESSGEEVQLMRYRGDVPGIADICIRHSRSLFVKLRAARPQMYTFSRSRNAGARK